MSGPNNAALQAAIAIELREVRGLIEGVAEMLVGDAHFAQAYLEQLQVFDFLAQCADESASLLDRLAAGTCPHEAVATVRLGAVQARLRAALSEAA